MIMPCLEVQITRVDIFKQIAETNKKVSVYFILTVAGKMQLVGGNLTIWHYYIMHFS